MKRKLTGTNYFIILEKNDIQESTPKIQKLMFGLVQTSHFGLWDISLTASTLNTSCPVVSDNPCSLPLI